VRRVTRRGSYDSALITLTEGGALALACVAGMRTYPAVQFKRKNRRVPVQRRSVARYFTTFPTKMQQEATSDLERTRGARFDRSALDHPAPNLGALWSLVYMLVLSDQVASLKYLARSSRAIRPLRRPAQLRG